MRQRRKVLLMIAEFRPVEGRGSLNFLFADDTLGNQTGHIHA